jgi:hypothetical protein
VVLVCVYMFNIFCLLNWITNIYFAEIAVAIRWQITICMYSVICSIKNDFLVSSGAIFHAVRDRSNHHVDGIPPTVYVQSKVWTHSVLTVCSHCLYSQTFNLIKIRSTHLLTIFYRFFYRSCTRSNNTPLRVASGVSITHYLKFILANQK